MKVRLFSSIALIGIFFSCKDVQEPSPNNRIEGVYEFVSEGNYGWGEKKFNFVDLMEFNSDGTVTGEGYTTEIGSDEILGYRSYFSGTYSISGDIVTIDYSKSYFMGIADINYLPKEDLTLAQVTDNIGSFSILENYTELMSICPNNGACGTPISFLRVE